MNAVTCSNSDERLAAYTDQKSDQQRAEDAKQGFKIQMDRWKPQHQPHDHPRGQHGEVCVSGRVAQSSAQDLLEFFDEAPRAGRLGGAVDSKALGHVLGKALFDCAGPLGHFD